MDGAMARVRWEALTDRAPRRRSSWREDLVAALFASVLVTGMFLDGRAHKLGIVDENETFFNIWHAGLYLGFLLLSAWVIRLSMTGSRHQRGPAPVGYGLSVLGILMFFVGGLADLIWHSIFGFEKDLEAGLSPPHLALLLSGMFLITGPFRAAWSANGPEARAPTLRAPTLRALTPALIVAGLALGGIVAFSNALLTPLPFSIPEGALGEQFRSNPEVVLYSDLLLLEKILVANFFFIAATLFLLKRWRLPFGALTLVYFVAIGLNTMEDNFETLWVGVAIAAAGLSADIIVQLVKPVPGRRGRFWSVGAAVPAVTWSLFFAFVASAYGLRWAPELWAGTVFLSALCGFGMSFVIEPPPTREPWQSLDVGDETLSESVYPHDSASPDPVGAASR